VSRRSDVETLPAARAAVIGGDDQRGPRWRRLRVGGGRRKSGTVGRSFGCLPEEVQMGVLVILEMDGPTDTVLAAAADLEARRPTSAVVARIVAPTESGVVVATFWESAEARDDYQSQSEHSEALRASGLLDAVTEMRSNVFEDAALTLR
jgi:hypothetical protein